MCWRRRSGTDIGITLTRVCPRKLHFTRNRINRRRWNLAARFLIDLHGNPARSESIRIGATNSLIIRFPRSKRSAGIYTRIWKVNLVAWRWSACVTMQMFAYSASRTRRLAQRVRNAAGTGRYSSLEYRSYMYRVSLPKEADGQGRGITMVNHRGKKSICTYLFISLILQLLNCNKTLVNSQIKYIHGENLTMKNSIEFCDRETYRYTELICYLPFHITIMTATGDHSLCFQKLNYFCITMVNC